MSNISIPNLPSQTATTDLDILVIVDSGETTTSKITRADFLSGVGGKIVNGSGTDSLCSVGLESQTTGTETLFINTDLSETSIVSGNNSIVIKTDAGNGGNQAGNDSVVIGAGNNNATGTAAVSIGGLNAEALASYSVSIGGFVNKVHSGADRSAIVSGYFNNIFGANGDYGFIGAGRSNDIYQQYCSILSGEDNIIASTSGGWSGILAGQENEITTGSHGAIIAGSGNTIDADNVVILGGNGITGDNPNTTYVPQLVMTEYASLDFADDGAAALGGVVLGGLYHNAGALRVRVL